MIKKLILAFYFSPFLAYSQAYTYFFDGDTSNIETATSYGICLMGGATENDQGAQWFLNKAGGGNILVLRTSGGDGYQNYFFNSLGVTVQSVETIVLNNSSAANDPFVLRKIENADAIWLAGGDQYIYELYFKSGPIQTLINEHINVKGAPLGGTSAGMAVLGDFYFNAENGTITSNEALNNPYDQNLTIESDFISIPILENTITDTHYDNPDRKGRHIAFIARMQENNINEDYFGIASDEFVAICIDENGIATIFGDYPDYEDNAFFLRTNCNRTEPSVLQPNTPLTWDTSQPAILACNVKATNDGQNQFDLNNWIDINGGSWEDWSVEQGVLTTAGIQHDGCISNTTANNLIEKSTTVYPNPAKDVVYIDSYEEILEIQLYDMKGQKLTVVENTNYLPLKSFKKGVYQIFVKNKSGNNISKKIVIID